MKRALAVLLAFVGFSAFAMFKGSWTADVCLVPTTSLSSTLSLTYTVAGFDITSTTGFGGTGITSQSFALKGAFGPFSIDGGMVFDPAKPAYLRSFVTTGFDFGGVGISLLVRHWVPAGWDSAWGTDPCTGTYDAGMQYTLTTTVAPVSLRVRFLDCCEGIEFQDLRVTLTGIDLCCGIKYNAELNFTKAGFSNLILSGINIPLCCGVSMDISVTYGVSSKSVTVTPKFAGIGEACFTVWGGPRFDGYIWEGIRVDAFRIRCTLGDCNYLEYVHAFAPAATTIPKAIRDKFICGADEYLELGFCGAGCCGGKYTATLRILWDAGADTASLFGLRAFVGTVSIPVMTNLTANLTFQMPAGEGVCPARFCFGWTFTF